MVTLFAPTRLQRRTVSPFACVLGAAMVAIVAWHWMRQPAYVVDDAYIYLRYVENVLSSRGWVFNPGEPYNTATSTLLVLLLVAEGWLFGTEHLPELNYATSLLGLLALGAGLYAFLRPAGRPVAAATALTALLAPHFYLTLGLATTMNMALLVGALLAFQRKRWNAMFAALALLPLIRNENGFLIPLLAAAAWRGDGVGLRFLGVRAALAGLPLAVWLGYSWIAFGDPLPVSLEAKLWQTDSGYLGTGLVYLGSLARYAAFAALPWARLGGVDAAFAQPGALQTLLHHPLVLALVVGSAGLVGLGAAASLRGRRLRGGGLLIAWALLHTLLYGVILNVPGYVWYFSVPFLTATWLLYAGAEALPARRLPWLGHAVLAILVASYAVVFAKEPAFRDVRSDCYANLSHWISAHTPPDAVVVHDEPGQIAYLTDRKIIDRLGLTTPQYLDRLQLGQKDLLWIGSLRRPEPVYYVTVSGHVPSPLVADRLEAMRVYRADDRLQTGLYHLDPGRFVLPDPGDTSVFDLSYRLEGPHPLTAQTLVPAGPDRIAAAFVLPPAPAPAAAAALTVTLEPAAKRFAALRFHGTTLTGAGVPSGDVRFSLTVRYGDGTADHHEGAQRPPAGGPALELFEFPLRAAKVPREIVLTRRDALVTAGLWAVCNPVLR